jgi:hypothetical protein
MLNHDGACSEVRNSVVWGNVASELGNDVWNGSVDTDTDTDADTDTDSDPPPCPTFQNSDIGWCGGSGAWVAACGTDLGGNIDSDPMFVSSSDLQLQAGSPCIDTGDNSLLPADVADLDGDSDTDEPLPLDLAGATRVADGNADSTATVDMGAYEYQP